MNVIAVRTSPTSKTYYIRGLCIAGSRADLRGWASICGHSIRFVNGAS